MIDFQQQLETLKNSLSDNMGTGKDSKEEEKTKENIKDNESIEIIEEATVQNEPPIEMIEKPPASIENSTLPSEQLSKKICSLKERVSKLETQINKPAPLIVVKQLPEEVSLESQLFTSMLDIYLYSVIINPKLQFSNPLYQLYKENLHIISQNILANSFRFFEKNSILDESLQLGKEIQKTDKVQNNSLKKIQTVLSQMKMSLEQPSYQKNLYFAKFLNERGLILNAVSMINEILGEYIVASAQNLSVHANERIQFHIDRISNTQTSRRAYYHFYKSAINFFYIQFNTQTEAQEATFFPYKDTGNEEIEMRFRRMFQSNKRNKSKLFSLYSEMIYRIRTIRNDLVHGNNQRHYHNIFYEIEDVLIDFEYLAIQKNFLDA